MRIARDTTHATMAPSAPAEVDFNNGKSQGEKRKTSNEDSGSTTEGQTASKAADAALQYVHEQAVEIDEETDKRIRHKIDRHILPWMCTLYLLQYMDKVTLSYAAVMGIKEDTHLTALQYSW
jgi:ribosomal protein S25